MDSFAYAIINFIRVRQLNIAVAAVLSGVYLIYQYWDVLTKGDLDALCPQHGGSRSRLTRSRSRSVARSRSRSRSRSAHYKLGDSKHRRGRKSYGRSRDY